MLNGAKIYDVRNEKFCRSYALTELVTFSSQEAVCDFDFNSLHTQHTTCTWDIMCQKWEGDCGLWVLNEIIKRMYPESLKKTVGAVWDWPAK